MKDEDIFIKIIDALMVDYTGVYCVNVKTSEYRWFSADPEYNSLCIAHEGKDFFASMKKDAEKVVYPEDRHLFTDDNRKERFLGMLRSGGAERFEYRLMIGGAPVYHTIRAIRGAGDGEDDDFVIFGVINIGKEVGIRRKTEKLREEREIYNQIAESLAENYDTIFYIDIGSGNFFEFSANEKYKALKVPTLGQDFFTETRDNARIYASPEDVDFAVGIYTREKMLENLSGKKSFSYKYRLMIDGEPRYYRFTVFRANDEKHLVICLKDVDDEIAAEKAMKRTQKKNITFGQIAESLAHNYDLIYYVDISDGSYAGYISNPIYGQLEVQEEGMDFFSELERNAKIIVHSEDRDRVTNALCRDNIISALDTKKQFSIDYRLIIDGVTKHTRFTVMWASDRNHVIIGVQNVDEEVRREKEHLLALNTEKELARRDGLTGTKNSTAYKELAHTVQNNIDNGMDYLPFALVVCDINGLKQINDTEGHHAGDDYIRACARLICDIFSHSPVFRIGGDEFVVFLRGGDYPMREKLFGKFRHQVLKNLGASNKPVIAAGMAAFEPKSDKSISEVFDRADNMMYENKRELKEQASSK
jgi:diguanylate cyclase (GGDEF)-like protein